MSITIWHNPACSKSRDVLRVIRAAGYEPEITLYAQTGWERDTLRALTSETGLGPRALLRTGPGPARGSGARELGLLEDGLSQERIFEAMLAHPTLVERPIVRTPKGTALCRPIGKVLDLLDNWPDGPFSLSNGTLLIDAQGVRAPGM